MSTTTIAIHFKGLRPCLFDRYPGDNTTKLLPEQKLYIDRENKVYLPALNIIASLATESQTCAANMVFKKQAREIKIGIQSFLEFESDKLYFTDDDGKPLVFDGFDDKQFSVMYHVAKVKKAGLSIPSPKERPAILTPWNIHFNVKLYQNRQVNVENLRSCFEFTQIMGVGTFRPHFGKFLLNRFEIIK